MALTLGCTDLAPTPFRLAEPHRHPDRVTGPNVVFVVLDTARADRVSCNGYARTTTPTLDSLAADGVNYTAAHSVAPWTLPSHMSMFTGLLPGEHGATWKAFAEPADAPLSDVFGRSLEPSDPERMLAQQLRRRGYHTAGFSSNAWVANRTGFEHGFDAFYEVWQERERLTSRWEEVHPWVRTAREMDRGDAGQAWMKFREHVMDQGGLEEPFFLFFNFIDPHYPYSPPPTWRYAWSDDREMGEKIARFEFSEMALAAGDLPSDVARFSPFYDAEMSYVDFLVGRLIGWLQRMGYYDETLIVVTSDHGEHLGENGRFSHQFSVDEPLLHIPLVIKYPGGERAGERNDDPRVSNLDVYSTILAAAGVQPPPSRSSDLGTPEGFERNFLISELYHAMPFLRAHQEVVPAFPVTEHAVTRRVVFDGAQRHLFVERPGGDPAELPTGETAAPGREAAAQLLRDYVRQLGSGLMQQDGQDLDPETLERLRSLGYVQ